MLMGVKGCSRFAGHNALSPLGGARARAAAQAATLAARRLHRHAATYTWDSSGTATAGNLVIDGSGTWSTTSANWWNTTTDQAWSSSPGTDTAVFGATAGSNPYTVNVSGAISAGAIDFKSQLYTLAGGTLTMANNSTSFASPDFFVAPRRGGLRSTPAVTKTTADAFLNGGGF